MDARFQEPGWFTKNVFLVSPRGHSQWVRNLRVSGRGRLAVGRRSEDFTATELRRISPDHPVFRISA